MAKVAIAGRYTLTKITEILQGTVTYTPTAGTTAGFVECLGGGGSGGAIAAPGLGNAAVGGGGGGGAYSASWLTGAAWKASFTVAVGAGGAAPGAGGNAGNPGGDTSFDSGTVLAKGGAGGATEAGAATIDQVLGGVGGAASAGAGDMKADGARGGYGFRSTGLIGISGGGANGPHGGGGAQEVKAQGDGLAAGVYGAGGSGGCSLNGGAAQNGGAGGNGLIRVWEFT